MKGTYLLEFSLSREITFKVKSGRVYTLPQGLYIYVGSAFGPGGIPSRLFRHLRRDKKRHWHLDFVTTSSYFTPLKVLVIPGLRVECQVASLVTPLCLPISSFGSSDCRCPSHLFLTEDLDGVNSLILKTFIGAKILKTQSLETRWSLRNS